MTILDSSATNLCSDSITEEVEEKLIQEDNCIVETSDNIPRMISDCSYNVNDKLLITFKPKSLIIEKQSHDNLLNSLENYVYL